jgi:hypothetical protein
MAKKGGGRKRMKYPPAHTYREVFFLDTQSHFPYTPAFKKSSPYQLLRIIDAEEED